jgi:flagellar protein FlaJ
MDLKLFYFLLGIGIVIIVFPFFMGLLMQSGREKDMGLMFLEFSRDLVDGVKSGTPISKSIINVRNKDYGVLSGHVQKLANQIAIGIPVKTALDTFAKDVKTPTISRAVNLIREAETSGGKIESILESVAFSVSQIEKLKKERKAAIYNIVIQGYIIFLIFIVIMLVMQLKILPLVGSLSIDASGLDSSTLTNINTGIGTTGSNLTAEQFSLIFLCLLLTQGFFAGLVIGKISEGSAKSGLKHSFILVMMSWLLSTGATLIFGT